MYLVTATATVTVTQAIRFTIMCRVWAARAGAVFAVYSQASPDSNNLTWQDHNMYKLRLRGDKLGHSNYSHKIRPAEHVEVSVRYNLLSINTLDMRTQTFSTSGWLTVKWEDRRLAWNREDYGNLSYMFDTEDVLWRPELIVANSVSNIGVIKDSALLLRVRYDGQVVWEPPGIHSVHCEMDTTYYPFDGQKCALDVASWAYNINEVNLTHLSTLVNLKDYVLNGEWSLLKTTLIRSELVEEEETFSELQFIFHVHRRPFYYVLNIMLPIGLTSILSSIVFILPFESGEKVSYALTVLLSYAVLMTIVADNIPPTSIKISVLGIYLALIMFVGCTSVFLSVINLYIYHQKEDRLIPPMLKRFVRGCLQRDSKGSHGGKPSTSTSPQKIVPVDTQTAWEDTKAGDNDCSDKYTWRDVALRLDSFLFTLYVVFIVVATIGFFVVLSVGGYLVDPTFV
ncbi:neuronal acetylcholine receptor subunit alpha-3-like [Haliotis cracherodii]|uniref:neuronal acetylcholine receptor subunit alpha-3-like n=1 Tax=Haliotis cracherodii TaxID=6455 RepID=UPI0039EC444A